MLDFAHHRIRYIFREVRGLEGLYSQCKARSLLSETAAGIAFAGLSDEDMLACQEALPPAERKARRIEVLLEGETVPASRINPGNGVKPG